jgi:hypothetical protein
LLSGLIPNFGSKALRSISRRPSGLGCGSWHGTIDSYDWFSSDGQQFIPISPDGRIVEIV